MKFIPGYQFEVTKRNKDFEYGERCKIHHISPSADGVVYFFITDHGSKQVEFDSINSAEAIISKISRR